MNLATLVKEAREKEKVGRRRKLHMIQFEEDRMGGEERRGFLGEQRKG